MSAILQTLAYLRMGVGASTYILPNQTLEHLTKAAPSSVEGVLVGRMFGARDFILGVSLLYAKNPEALKMALQMGLFCDLVDVGAGLIAWKNGMDRKGWMWVSGGSAFFAILGIYLLHR
ncbi:predicted protein [Naegleria gruberi]|uniref:Predicted protein n=1 Tax=Naegleria gruberi TaxID=5762 RepID=D2VNI4_NAEGR|nr:uncharacterized protein NAEGRDRAFT_70511 [Naegleria gruberi]EFC41739.1 predicted protein [Naegleria gruberi]|eukprot:XP_002674483.1 predicted protein [Naegleria gruberi strain NEG-M]